MKSDTTPEAVVKLLRASRMPVSSEAALQESITNILATAGIEFEREARISAGNRIDWLVAGGVGIEAKTRYGKRPIFRQLQRYAEHEQITSLILVTGTALGLPAAMHGKPIYYVSIGRAAL